MEGATLNLGEKKLNGFVKMKKEQVSRCSAVTGIRRLWPIYFGVLSFANQSRWHAGLAILRQGSIEARLVNDSSFIVVNLM